MARIDSVLSRLDTRMGSVGDRIKAVVGDRSDPEIDKAIDGVRKGFARGLSGSKIGLCVGLPFVDKAAYGGSDQPCIGCDFDAKDFTKILEAAGFETSLLLSEKATRAGVVAAMKSAAERLSEGGLFVMSIAGHGARRPVPEDGNRPHEYWCLWDGMLIDSDIIAAVKMFRAGVRIVMINDQCHCGGIFTCERGDMPMLIQFAACRAEQSSMGTPIGGTWTTALMKVLAVDRDISWRQWFDKAVAHPSLTANQSPQWVEIGPVNDSFRNEKIFGGSNEGTVQGRNIKEDNMKFSLLSNLVGGLRGRSANGDGGEERATKKFCKKCGKYTWVEGNYTGSCQYCGVPFAREATPEDGGEERATKKFCKKCGKYTWVEGNYTGSCQYCGASFAREAAPEDGDARSDKRFCRICGTYTYAKTGEVYVTCRKCGARL